VNCDVACSSLVSTGSFFYSTIRLSYFREATKELAVVEAPEFGAKFGAEVLAFLKLLE